MGGVRGSRQQQLDRDFTAFVSARSGRLLHLARLLVADRHTAEDLVQDVLARCYVRWRRVSADDPDAYVRRALVNAATDHYRSARRRELPSEAVPEVSAHRDHAGPLGDRHAVLASLDSLTPRERSVVVLRYYEDLTEAATAAWLGVPVGTVKSLHHRALRKLRVDPELADRAAAPEHESTRR